MGSAMPPAQPGACHEVCKSAVTYADAGAATARVAVRCNAPTDACRGPSVTGDAMSYPAIPGLSRSRRQRAPIRRVGWIAGASLLALATLALSAGPMFA